MPIADAFMLRLRLPCWRIEPSAQIARHATRIGSSPCPARRSAMPNDASVIKGMPFEPPSFSPRTKPSPSDRRGLIERRALQVGTTNRGMSLSHDNHHA
jgi:hypothetical protein